MITKEAINKRGSIDFERRKIKKHKHSKIKINLDP